MLAVATDDARRSIGTLGERIAERHLLLAGYEIVERNYRTRHGELDLVAAGADCIVFCEVKTRLASGVRGPDGPLDAIGARKRRQIRLMAAEWLHERSATAGSRRAPSELRFDAIGVTLSPVGAPARLEHVEAAF